MKDLKNFIGDLVTWFILIVLLILMMTSCSTSKKAAVTEQQASANYTKKEETAESRDSIRKEELRITDTTRTANSVSDMIADDVTIKDYNLLGHLKRETTSHRHSMKVAKEVKKSGITTQMAKSDSVSATSAAVAVAAKDTTYKAANSQNDSKQKTFPWWWLLIAVGAVVLYLLVQRKLKDR